MVATQGTVQRYIELPKDSKGQHATHTDNDVVVQLDIKVHPKLMDEWLARELMNCIQKLRKKARLQTTDNVELFYHFVEGNGADLVEVMKKYGDLIQKTCRNVPVDAKECKEGSCVTGATAAESATCSIYY